MDVVSVMALVAFGLAVASYGTIIGAGGGFILIPGLVVVFDLTGVEAVGTGALTLAAIGIGGARTYDRAGLVDRPAAGRFVLGSVPVAFLCGSLLAGRIDSDVLIDLLGVLLLGLAMLVVALPAAPVSGCEPAPRSLRWMPFGGVVVGFLGGTFAIGGGLITLPFLGHLRRLDPHRAAATTAATAMIGSLASSAGHTLAGTVVWSHVAVLAPSALVGSTLAAGQAGRLAPRTVLVLVAGGLVVAGVSLLVR